VITDGERRVALSNLGWVDYGAIWRFDMSTGAVDHIQLGDAKHLALRACGGEEFSVVHYFDGSRVEITTHTFADPSEARRRVVVSSWAPTVSADLAPWPSSPSFFVAWLNDDATAASGYFLISVQDRQAAIERLDWFDGDSYDLGYQSVIAVSEVPRSGDLVFGIQRSSHLVVSSPSLANSIRRVDLSGGHGNAVPHVRVGAAEIWTVDYDTLVRLDWRSWEVTGTLRLQEASSGTRMFVGDLWMPPDEQYVPVPRPGTGDIIAIDPVRLAQVSVATTGRQPLVAAVLGDRRVVARDWKIGDLLVGDLA
jgi:hypothetical protein